MSPLVGAWQVTLLVHTELDLQEWTTRWEFNRDGTCEYKQTTFSFLEGVARTKLRGCTFTDRGSVVTVVYKDTTFAQDLPYSFAFNDPRRLVLEGIEYQRVG